VRFFKCSNASFTFLKRRLSLSVACLRRSALGFFFLQYLQAHVRHLRPFAEQGLTPFESVDLYFTLLVDDDGETEHDDAEDDDRLRLAYELLLTFIDMFFVRNSFTTFGTIDELKQLNFKLFEFRVLLEFVLLIEALV
jgi:hypothetical protein